ncbi:adenosylcobinamide-GDP ribazoletransferase [Actinoplanes philippinensis]|uniref:Adenosylcobinamide-GDP ribazoletransferase n=1 Tax=Actinoplanes philippinensis TaxID=35752 RepID=A0A1I2BTQ3_9ACTN|nr:adenosylcobinamide-GDP ribazoletransferase [Actinoplanes philippinensis]GIE76108.1 adenosylcobinamide-GDP ribazoletransferase [Actinoplanes philippinensis]SFE59482.1 adenosylcobinamide-GDP ribazoletransferase [Actinoplanes philippinensis]
MLDGVRLAVTTLTVLPLRAGRVDRSTAAVAMSVAPVVGALLGLALAGLHAGLRAAGSPELVAAGLTVAAGALLTRGLHLDGLADTVDALGSYRSGPAALDIMKKPDIGPFGVVALCATVVVQAAALTAAGPWALVTAWAAGRLAVSVACRRGVPPARPEGLGAMVASTVPLAAVAAGAAFVGAIGVAAVPGRPWQGPAAVAAALFAVVLLLRHAVRRFGGITGDVLGAAVELAVTLTLVLLTLAPGRS